ncbi:taste receptor type 1 member 2-like [Salarias fasciatus]|uniref:taste receptor type 1 member 2-like n=1 Tax=Salarias fasciatus TaxID=181472 RepID=UPI001176BD72|nr:taste receptor type 1 member 2-like [Salarias fasciatus]
MIYFFSSLCFWGIFINTLTQHAVPASEFYLEGDYLIGGFFDIHRVAVAFEKNRPEAIDCSRHAFIPSSYRRFQLMRFSVEQINNSTNLLPNVHLGYEIFDQCLDAESFPSILNLMSADGLVEPWADPQRNLTKGPKAIAVVGPFTSTDTLTTAPLFVVDLVPVVSYGAGSSAFSDKSKFTSFLRMGHANKGTIEVIASILQHFNWRWVAFLKRDDTYGIDGLELFMKRIEKTNICLAYTYSLNDNTNYSQIFKQIEAQKVKVIIVFVPKLTAEAIIESAVHLNITDKVWIAADTWSLNKRLHKLKGIRHIGTVIGVSQPVIPIPGFSEFLYSTRGRVLHEYTKQNLFCNQVCNCSGLSPEEVISLDPSFSFYVYSAVYAIAHALHNALQCGAGKCDSNVTVYPHMILAELKKSKFKLLNQTVEFDENGQPRYTSYRIVFWNSNGDAQEVGYYEVYPSSRFLLNSTEIQWHTEGEVPTSVCTQECPVGYKKKQEGIHTCCFSCEICQNGTFINVTEDPYTCVSCTDAEWSAEGSTSCSLQVVEFVPFTDTGAVVIMVAALVLVGLNLAVSVLFAINYNTPVVRSAGGPMCFLILICLTLSSLSVYFYFGQPTAASCILRFFPFLLFYTVCLACFVVRSFQIVFIFKIAAKLPKLYSWWMKYHGQWLVIAVASAIQALLLIIGYSYDPPKPFNETFWYQDKIVLDCKMNFMAKSSSVFFLSFLCCLCFIFSYMGKDLPKNYNEAKSITFCLMLFILTWITFITIHILYRGKYILTLNALAVLSSLYSFLLWYFLPKCLIIIFQPQRNTQQYFQGLIQSYTKTISQ